MKNLLPTVLLLTSLAAATPVVQAQEEDQDFHPALSDNFILSLGAFRSDHSFKISAKGQIVDIDDQDIDFGDSVGVDESATLFNGQLRWKFGKGRKWSLWGQYFENKARGDATLKEDVSWQDIVFREGTFVEAEVAVKVTRVFLGRSLVKNAQHDFGIGAGIHNLDLSAYIGGEVLVDDESTGYQRAPASASQILPNIGAWYNFSPAKKWLLHGRIDWISADINDYDGSMWNGNVGVNFQAFKHFGIDLSYQYFNIDLNVTRESWRGGVEMSYSGPVIALTANW
jgi:hypothetical protein